MQAFSRSERFRPQSVVADAWDSLERLLAEAVMDKAESPTDLLAHLTNSDIAREPLKVVQTYLHANGFVDSAIPGSSTLYYVLGVNPLTMSGRLVAFVKGSDGSVLVEYSPGYSVKTPLKEFLMQELIQYPRKQTNVRGVAYSPRDRRVGVILSRLRTAANKEGHKFTSPAELTIGNYVDMPVGAKNRLLQHTRQELDFLLGRFNFL